MTDDSLRPPEGVADVPAAASDSVPADRVDRLALLQGRRLYAAIGLLFLLALFFRFFDIITRVGLIAFVGAIVAMALHSIVIRIPVRRGFATALLALAILGVVGLIVWQGTSYLMPQLQSLAMDLPQFRQTIEGWQTELQNRTGMDWDLLGAPLESLLDDPLGMGVGLLSRAFGVLEILGIIVLVLAGSVYIVAQPNEQLLDPLLRAVPKDRQPAFRRTMGLMGERLGGWLRGTLLSMVIIGVLSFLAFWLLGTPYPLLLGVIAGSLEFIPIIGPWVAGAIAVAVTFFHDPQTALYVAIAALVIQQLEGNLVYPFVMSGSAEIHPFVTLLALLLFGALFGFLGALLALPLTLAIGSVVQVFWVEETLGNYESTADPLVDTERK